MSDKLEEFGSLVKNLTKGNKAVSTIWATVTEHNQDGTFDCRSVSDGLEYFDVLPGLSAFEMKPKNGSKCLIGIIQNSNDAFLIVAEEIDEIKLNGDGFEGIVKAPELKTQLDKNTAFINKVQQVFGSWTPVPSDGAAALKTLSTQFTSLQTADLSNIQNEIVKHG